MCSVVPTRHTSCLPVLRSSRYLLSLVLCNRALSHSHSSILSRTLGVYLFFFSLSLSARRPPNNPRTRNALRVGYVRAISLYRTILNVHTRLLTSWPPLVSQATSRWVNF